MALARWLWLSLTTERQQKVTGSVCAFGRGSNPARPALRLRHRVSRDQRPTELLASPPLLTGGAHSSRLTASAAAAAPAACLERTERDREIGDGDREGSKDDSPFAWKSAVGRDCRRSGRRG
ncbi:unnamed protein product [Lampetra planeri]